MVRRPGSWHRRSERGVPTPRDTQAPVARRAGALRSEGTRRGKCRRSMDLRESLPKSLRLPFDAEEPPRRSVGDARNKTGSDTGKAFYVGPVRQVIAALQHIRLSGMQPIERQLQPRPGGGNTDLRRKWSDDRQEPVGNDAVRFGGRMDGIPENVIGARPVETPVEQREGKPRSCRTGDRRSGDWTCSVGLRRWTSSRSDEIPWVSTHGGRANPRAASRSDG